MAVTEDDRITIVDRHGNAHEIPIARIEAARVFPVGAG
jgi:hypothetical protein